MAAAFKYKQRMIESFFSKDNKTLSKRKMSANSQNDQNEVDSHERRLHFTFKLNDSSSKLVTELKKKELNQSYSLDYFYHCENRLETFHQWSRFHPLKAENLAQAGFCYVGYGEICICPWCEKTVDAWRYFDEPFSKHKEISFGVKCPYLRYIFFDIKEENIFHQSPKRLIIEEEDTNF